MARWINHLVTCAVPDGSTLGAELKKWLRQNGCWYVASAIVHAIGFVGVAIVTTFLPAVVAGALGGPFGRAPTFEAADVDNTLEVMPERFDIGDAPLEPSRLDLETLGWGGPAPQEAKYFDDSEEFEDAGGGRPAELAGPLLGGLGGFRVQGLAGIGGLGGVGTSSGEGDVAGAGGSRGQGLGGRGKGHREALLGVIGGTKASERSVAGGLHWLARHQAAAGNWSIQHNRACSGRGCGGQGSAKSDSAATALALLPFLGAGQTHKVKGPYQREVAKGIAWMLKHQAPDGDLSAGCPQRMYAHGLATIALCEAYGLSKDPAVGAAASKGVRFVEQAQNESTGGWRYEPGDPGDTSVTGWQVMALKSAQMAGLGVNSLSLENTRKWLASVAAGQHQGLFQYQPYREVSPSMTSVGMLCHQYLGMARDDPAMQEGKQYLMAHLPDPSLQRDVYYWYYATLAMHNLLGPDWDAWNRQMRRTLIGTQVKEKDSCANGSWDPDRPTPDRWGSQGGRLMVTSLSILTLEVYYRYLPLFRINLPPSTSGAANKMGVVSGR